jgi:uncharacterized membrane protein YtjA (UPF0391 family)
MDVSAFPLGRRTDAPTRQRRQKDSKYPQEATRFSKGDAADNVVSKAALPRADISTVALGFSPSFGSSPVSLALANSKVATAALAGPSHNSAVRVSNRVQLRPLPRNSENCYRSRHQSSQQGDAMATLRWALIFLIISLVAGALGFSGISAGAGRISKILFVIFGVLFLLVVLVAYLIGEAFF